MQKYELIYIAPPTLTEKDLPIVSQKVQSAITKLGGKIIQAKWAGQRKLGYAIKHRDQGFYGITHYEIDSQRIGELERDLHLNTAITRFMITIIKPESPNRKPPRRRLPKITKDLKPAMPFTKPAAAAPKEPHAKAKKVSLEELDQKLDELLKDDIVK